VTRIRLGRAVVAASSVALLATMLLGGVTQAANNRSVYFGSPTADGGTGGGYKANGDLDFGSLTNTPVTAGKKWATNLHLENTGSQTLNHVKVAGGTSADPPAKPYNPLFSEPTGTSLPSGASFAAVVPLTSGITCDPNTSSGFECSVGTLGAGGFADFLIVVTAPPTKGTYGWWLTGSWNEGWSSTGTNADYNFAVGSVVVKESNCGNGQSSYFFDEIVGLNDGSTDICNTMDAGLKSGDKLTGNGGFATMSIDSTFAVACPEGYRCGGKTVSASVIDGVAVPGGVEWTVTWFGTKTVKGVIHFLDTYDADDPDHADDFVAIPFTKAFKCTSPGQTECWRSPLVTSAGNTKPMFVTAVFVTAGNGKAGGLF
jgi:hypothetical protein